MTDRDEAVGRDEAPKAIFGRGRRDETDTTGVAVAVAAGEPAAAVPARSSASLPMVGLAVGVATVAGAVAGYQWARSQMPARVEAAVPVAAPVREAGPRPTAQSQQAARALARWSAEAFVPLDPSTTAFDGLVERVRLAPPFDAVDSAVFDSSDQRIRLARILPIGRTEVCSDAEGKRFACGLMSRAALQNLVARRSVACDRLFLPREERTAVIDADCTVDGVDLAEHLLRSGWATPSPLAGDHHRAALAEAQARGAGVWAGPYVPAERDRAEDDIRAIPFGSLRLPATDPASLPPPKASVEVPAKPAAGAGAAAVRARP